MAGDPKQLGPILYSHLAGLYGLGKFDTLQKIIIVAFSWP